TEGITTLRQLDAILVGGAATPTELINRAKDHNINLITTYGMSETCGGCVYNGHPIGDTTITFTTTTATATATATRIQLTGTHIAHGYLHPTDNPTTLTLNTNTPFTHHPNGTRTYLTDDIGHINPDGTLTLEGRTDDIINTGGLKVLPTHVENALIRALPKPIWALGICLFPIVGGTAWWLAGRPQRPRPQRPIGPDDDPDFLRGL
ncbi:AMP-binding protein, partial [Dermatophilus congolensis]